MDGVTHMNNTKYVVVLCDGMSDYPVPALNGKTPMEYAKKPNMDYFASNGICGLVSNVPEGLKPGSDVANLSVMGYDPKVYYSGRSPLEAVSMGIKLASTDVALRCNLVTLSDEENYEDKKMVDYCAGDISTAEASELINAVNEAFKSEKYDFHPGFSYRHCLVWHNGNAEIGNLTPPHDISGRVVGEYLKSFSQAPELLEMMKKSVEILKNHPVNIARVQAGKRPASSIWLWGQGTAPALDLFEEKYGKKGAVISAVDLIKGIGICAGMKVCEVEGATGYVDTNFDGKVKAAIDELNGGADFAYLHFEAPDECGHRGEMENKIRSIELIDEKVLAVLRAQLDKYDNYRLLILPDHPTPLATMTHEMDPVPFILYDKKADKGNGEGFCVSEETAKASGVRVEQGCDLMSILFEMTAI